MLFLKLFFFLCFMNVWLLFATLLTLGCNFSGVTIMIVHPGFVLLLEISLSLVL